MPTKLHAEIRNAYKSAIGKRREQIVFFAARAFGTVTGIATELSRMETGLAELKRREEMLTAEGDAHQKNLAAAAAVGPST